MLKINTSYSHLSQPDFVLKVKLIIFMLTGNLFFTHLPVDPADIDTELGDYIDDLSASQSGDMQATARATAKRKEIQANISNNGQSINSTAAGNEEKLVSSDYTMSAEKNYQEKDAITVVKTNYPNVFKVIVWVADGACAYQVEQHIDPLPVDPAEQKWKRNPISKQHYTTVRIADPEKYFWLHYYYATKDGETGPSVAYRFRMT